MDLAAQHQGPAIVDSWVEVGLYLALSGGISALIMGRKGRSRWAGWALGLLGVFGILIAAVLPRLPEPGTEPRAAQGPIRRPAMVTAAAVTLLAAGGIWWSVAIFMIVVSILDVPWSDDVGLGISMGLVLLGFGLSYIVAGIRVLRLWNTWRVVGILLLVFSALFLIGTWAGVAEESERGEASGVVALALAILAIASSLWSAWLIFFLVKHRRLFSDSTSSLHHQPF